MKRLAPKASLSNEEINAGLGALLKDGLFSQSMITLTQGTFLIAFALRLGASNAIIGMLVAIFPLTQLLQIPSVLVVEKYRTRKAITAYASAGARSFWLLIALIPFLFAPEVGLAVLIISVTLNQSIAALAACARNSWWRDFVPQDQLGTFFSKRMRFATTLSIPLILVAAFYIDYLKNSSPSSEIYGYSALFFLGFAAGMISVYFISRTPEPEMAPVVEERKFTDLIMKPFKDENFKKIIVFLGVWNFAVNMAAPFFTVYMLRVLGLEISAVIALTVLSLLMNITFLRIWGAFSDRYSNKSVLAVCGPMFIVAIFAWTFTTMSGWYVLTLPLLVIIHILLGTSTAGVALASQNIGLKLSPKGQATSYLASSSFVNSLAAGFAPMLGGVLADFFAHDQLSWTIQLVTPGGTVAFQTLDFHQWDFVFIAAVLIGIYSIHRLTMVKEIGEVKGEVVFREFVSEVKRGLRTFSTAEGLERMVGFPYAIAKSSYSYVKSGAIVKPVAKIIKSGVGVRPVARIIKGKLKKGEEPTEESESSDASAEEDTSDNT